MSVNPRLLDKTKTSLVLQQQGLHRPSIPKVSENSTLGASVGATSYASKNTITDNPSAMDHHSQCTTPYQTTLGEVTGLAGVLDPTLLSTAQKLRLQQLLQHNIQQQQLLQLQKLQAQQLQVQQLQAQKLQAQQLQVQQLQAQKLQQHLLNLHQPQQQRHRPLLETAIATTTTAPSDDDVCLPPLKLTDLKPSILVIFKRLIKEHATEYSSHATTHSKKTAAEKLTKSSEETKNNISSKDEVVDQIYCSLSGFCQPYPNLMVDFPSRERMSELIRSSLEFTLELRASQSSSSLAAAKSKLTKKKKSDTHENHTQDGATTLASSPLPPSMSVRQKDAIVLAAASATRTKELAGANTAKHSGGPNTPLMDPGSVDRENIGGGAVLLSPSGIQVAPEAMAPLKNDALSVAHQVAIVAAHQQQLAAQLWKQHRQQQQQEQQNREVCNKALGRALGVPKPNTNGLTCFHEDVLAATYKSSAGGLSESNYQAQALCNAMGLPPISTSSASLEHLHIAKLKSSVVNDSNKNLSLSGSGITATNPTPMTEEDFCRIIHGLKASLPSFSQNVAARPTATNHAGVVPSELNRTITHGTLLDRSGACSPGLMATARELELARISLALATAAGIATNSTAASSAEQQTTLARVAQSSVGPITSGPLEAATEGIINSNALVADDRSTDLAGMMATARQLRLATISLAEATAAGIATNPTLTSSVEPQSTLAQPVRNRFGPIRSSPSESGVVGIPNPNVLESGTTVLTPVCRFSFPIVVFQEVDRRFLREFECALRQQLVIFEAEMADVEAYRRNTIKYTDNDNGVSGERRPKSIRISQIGSRCRHCATKGGKSNTQRAFWYPTSLNEVDTYSEKIYEEHFRSNCSAIHSVNLLKDLKMLEDKKNDVSSRKRIKNPFGDKYWSVMLSNMGIYEDKVNVMLRVNRGKKNGVTDSASAVVTSPVPSNNITARDIKREQKKKRAVSEESNAPRRNISGKAPAVIESSDGEQEEINKGRNSIAKKRNLSRHNEGHRSSLNSSADESSSCAKEENTTKKTRSDGNSKSSSVTAKVARVSKHASKRKFNPSVGTSEDDSNANSKSKKPKTKGASPKQSLVSSKVSPCYGSKIASSETDGNVHHKVAKGSHRKKMAEQRVKLPNRRTKLVPHSETPNRKERAVPKIKQPNPKEKTASKRKPSTVEQKVLPKRKVEQRRAKTVTRIEPLSGRKHRPLESKRTPKSGNNAATRKSTAPQREEDRPQSPLLAVTTNDKLDESFEKALPKSVQLALARLAPYNGPGRETDGDNAFILSNALSAPSSSKRRRRSRRLKG